MAMLSIVIPAYDEEEAIASILERCLAAREAIREKTGLAVEVVAVDDGSGDRTREIAARYPEARLVVHPKNRGYGAALMTGFESAKGELLGFLDADGTCDPEAFIDLCSALSAEGADLAIGNRLHPGSRMPITREAGNRLFAFILSTLTGVDVKDTASGMRVFKRNLLPRLAPLPTGLHFTPAMTARAACLRARIVEVPIPYAERRGRSKLNILEDGFRFLRVILGTVFAYYPLKVFGPMGVFFGALALSYSLHPVSYYLRQHALKEDMIYRLLTILTLTVCGLVVLAFGIVAQKASDIATRRPRGLREDPWLEAASMAIGAATALGGVLLNSRTLLQYLSSGRITLHWAYVLTGALAVISGTVLFCFGVTLAIVSHLPRALGAEEGEAP